jgi:ADP-ribosylglycohydrolase
MKGAIAGDIIGSHWEFLSNKDRNFPLFGEHYYYTDDTILTLAVAETLLDGTGYEDSLVKWSRRYPHQAWGIRYKSWFRSDDRAPYNSFGNGSAMRVSAVGWAFETLEETEREAERSAEVTHNHPEGIKGARSVAAAIFMARNGSSKSEIREYLERRYGYDLSRRYADIQPGYLFDGTCQGSVPEALIAFLDSTDFEDTIRNAVALGGDADTQACIAGSVAEAFYGGVPVEIWRRCESVLEPEMCALVERFVLRYGVPVLPSLQGAVSNEHQHMQNEELVDFLRGTGLDSHGRYHADILKFSDEELEETHDYIQWLFPLREESRAVPGSPHIESDEAVRILRGDEDVQENIVNALVRMERFYRDNDFWLSQNDHNHLRITRILKSVSLLSSKENARDFYDFIMRKVEAAKPVTEESLEYWKRSIS